MTTVATNYGPQELFEEVREETQTFLASIDDRIAERGIHLSQESLFCYAIEMLARECSFGPRDMTILIHAHLAVHGHIQSE